MSPAVPGSPAVSGSPAAAGARRPARGPAPTLRAERAVLRAGHPLVGGVDEVGRGALAGPVSVGVVVVTADTPSAPAGLRDSKLLTPAAREALVPRLRRWAPAWAVGHAEAEEVDAVGVLRALRLAGTRALAALPEPPPVVLLDGNYDWLSRPLPPPGAPALARSPAVTTQVKADLRCAAVAAASVLAKVERDAIMVERSREHPGYGWEANKGYSCAAHHDALRRLGPCAEHRRSWRLPGADPVLFDLDDPADVGVDLGADLVVDLRAVEERDAGAPAGARVQNGPR